MQTGDQPILNLAGDLVALGPLNRDHVPLWTKWMNDFEVTRALAVGLRPMTREAEEAWYERVTQSERDVVFTIYEVCHAANRQYGPTHDRPSARHCRVRDRYRREGLLG